MEVTRGDFRACAEKTEKSLCSKGSLEINRCVILSIRYWTIAQIRSCTQIQSPCQSISKTPWLLQLQCCAVEDVQKAGSKVLAWSQLASAHPREQLPPHVSKYLLYLPPPPAGYHHTQISASSKVPRLNFLQVEACPHESPCAPWERNLLKKVAVTLQ